jgi:hypothetical protein
MWPCLLQVWGVGGKFGTSAAVGIVLPPSAQMVEKQGWTYASRPNQIMRKAHEAQSEISSLAFSQVRQEGPNISCSCTAAAYMGNSLLAEQQQQ